MPRQSLASSDSQRVSRSNWRARVLPSIVSLRGLSRRTMVESLPRHVIDAVVSRIPLSRLGEAKEVARCVRFLLDEGAGYITGAVIAVNGGLEM